MVRYLFFRVLRGLASIVIVVGIVMALVYSTLDRNLIFAADPVFSRQKSNAQQVYKMQQWEQYGYVDYVSYAEYLAQNLQGDAYAAAVTLGDTPAQDSADTKAQTEAFRSYYESQGYTVTRLTGLRQGGGRYREGGEPRLFAHRDVPLLKRMGRFFSGLFHLDTPNSVPGDVGERGLTFTWFDPVYGGEKFSPAILGNGTYHKYLLYFDDRFPWLHQNFLTVNLGQSYSVNTGVDVWQTMTEPQGARELRTVTYPSGHTALTADDLHTATYAPGSYEAGDAVTRQNFVDDYTAVATRKQGLSRLGYSFVIGIAAVAAAYLPAIPIALVMARKKGGLGDLLGSIYIAALLAVPSLAYVFLLKALGGAAGLPVTFDLEAPTAAMLILPILSLTLPTLANLMKWLRRYLVDQKHALYVRFARANGASEGETMRLHVLRNAIIPILHGLPASILGALVGAILTERVYVVPGAGNLLTRAINAYDNGVIVGLTLFYAVLSVVSVILGDLVLSAVDPRISLAGKEG